MTLTDIIILIFVIAFLGSIIYFKWIKKSNKNGLGCHCYKRNSCNIKVSELKDLLKKEL